VRDTPRTAKGRATTVSDALRWVEHNLRVQSVHELRAHGVKVYVAPSLPADVRLVRLADGKVDVIQPQEHPRHDEYHAEEASLVEYCRRENIQLYETNGYMVAEPPALPHS
jgi:hypothetical protein